MALLGTEMGNITRYQNTNDDSILSSTRMNRLMRLKFLYLFLGNFWSLLNIGIVNKKKYPLLVHGDPKGIALDIASKSKIQCSPECLRPNNNIPRPMYLFKAFTKMVDHNSIQHSTIGRTSDL